MFFMLTQDAAEELNQHNDYMFFVTGVTGTTGTTFYTQHTIFNITKAFGHVVDEAQSESKTKQTTAASVHLQYCMGAISNQPSRWEDLEHFHMTHFLGGGG